MTRPHESSRGIRKLLTRGAQWIGNFIQGGDLDGAVRQGLTPGPLACPVTNLATLPPDGRPAPSNPTDPTPNRTFKVRNPETPAPTQKPPGPFDVLTVKIKRTVLLLNSVEDSMDQVARAYRRGTTASLLVLVLLRNSKYRTPRRLEWAKLSQKKVEFDPRSLALRDSRRRRWWRRLKIRVRRDLESAIYFSGASERKTSILTFYDPVRVLNQAHAILARCLAAVGISLKSRMARLVSPKPVPPDVICNPHLDCMRERRGLHIGGAWALVEAIKETESALEGLCRKTGGLRLRLIFQLGPGPATKIPIWEDTHTGRKYTRLRRITLRRLNPTSECLDRLTHLEKERIHLMRSLSQRRNLLVRVEARLEAAEQKAKAVMDSCNPDSQWIFRTRW